MDQPVPHLPQALATFIKENLDYCVFALVVLAVFLGLQLSVWKKHHRLSVTVVAWLLVLGALAGTWHAAEHEEKKEVRRLRQKAKNQVLAYADEFTLLGHEQAGLEPKPEMLPADSGELRKYEGLLNTGKLLRKASDGSVKNIFTVRRGEDGAFRMVLDLNADASFLERNRKTGAEEAPPPSSTSVGELYAGSAADLDQAVARTDQVIFNERIRGAKEGGSVTAFYHLFKASGMQTDGVLGVEYDPAVWRQAIKNARWICFAVFGGFILLVLVFATVASVVVLTQQNVDQTRHAQTLEESRRRFEALVNSIDGIVWEYDPVTLRFLYVSSQAEAMLGWSRRAWVEQANFRLKHVHAEDQEAMLAAIHHAVSTVEPYTCVYRMVATGQREVYIRESGALVAGSRVAVMRGISTDITAQKEAERELNETHKRLLITSRQAGMAEVATGVLHNVGNVLNSVNVSVSLVQEKLTRSRLPSLAKAARLLEDHREDLPRYLGKDAKGSLLPNFLSNLTAHLQDEQAAIHREVESLMRNVEHIRDIVSAQQSHASLFGNVEPLAMANLADLALRLNTNIIERSQVRVSRDYRPAPPVFVDKHKVLQILINLLRNAIQACDQGAPAIKTLHVSIESTEATVRLTIRDNGVGIAPKDLTRIFSLGFTTKEHGHGFGLHSGAIAAQEMGGSLFARSNGHGAGAAFVLELPLKPHTHRHLTRYAVATLSPARH